MRMIGFRTPIPEGYFRMLTSSSLQAPALVAPDTVDEPADPLAGISSTSPPPVASVSGELATMGFSFTGAAQV